MLNLFSLHGKYFQDDENRLTANILFLLSENRRTFLRTFLAALGYDCTDAQLAKTEILFQSSFEADDQLSIPDAELIIGDDIHVLIEAKIGTNRLYRDQISRYSQYLAECRATSKKLVCITQVNQLKTFHDITGRINYPGLSSDSFQYFQWHEILDMLRTSIGANGDTHSRLDAAIRRGRKVGYAERLASLFIQELENTMYDKKIVGQLPSGSIPDVTVTTQRPWFMWVALKHNVWFPSGATQYGLGPSKYVAYYETSQKGNENPKTIACVAKNVVYWNRITLSDARQIHDLSHLFEDEAVNKVITSWYPNDDDTFHVALTEPPIKLAHPIPLGKKNVARVLSKRKCSFGDLIGARTIDDLF